MRALSIATKSLLVVISFLISMATNSYAATSEFIGGLNGGYIDWYIQQSISSDGRYVVFNSTANNILPGDTNNAADVFLYDRETKSYELISIAADGSFGNYPSFSPALSADGMLIAFISSATNIATVTAPGLGCVYVRDKRNGKTEATSLCIYDNVNRNYSPSISADGRYVVMKNEVYDRQTKSKTSLVNISNPKYLIATTGDSISGDGRYVTFASLVNLVPEDVYGNTIDIYVKDMQTGAYELVNKSSQGDTGLGGQSDSPSISNNGRYVCYISTETNLVSNDEYNTLDVFVYDRETKKTERVNIDSYGNVMKNYVQKSFVFYPARTCTMSDDGRFVVFMLGPDEKWYSNIFLRDRKLGTTELVDVSMSPGDTTNHDSYNPDVSSDGRFVSFISNGRFIHPGDAYSHNTDDLFVRDFGPRNQTPTANAGADQVVECAGPSGSSVVLDGSASTDLDGDTLTYTWTGSFGSASGPSPTITLPLGVHDITLTVDDGNGGSASDTMTVTVADTVAASTSAMISGTMGNAGWYVSPVTITLSSTDSCSGTGSITYDLNGTSVTVQGSSATITLTDGIHSLSFASTDAAGNTEASKQITANIDATAPVITISGVTDGAAYDFGSQLTPTSSATDALSGLASLTDTLSGGNAYGLGSFTYSVTATDVAGNVANITSSYTVSVMSDDGLLALIRKFVALGLIAPELEQSLTQKVLNSMAAKSPVAADNLLQALANEIQAHTGAKIDAGASAILINAINYVIAHN